MTSRLIRVAIITVALLLAALLVPDIEVDWSDEAEGAVLTLLAVALVFGFVNGFIRPIAKLVSIPLNLLTLGMFSVVLNAALLLLVAYLVDLVLGPLIVIGGYPPELGIEAIAAAAMGSFIISAVSTALTVLIPES
jgi:putative membrane protein